MSSKSTKKSRPSSTKGSRKEKKPKLICQCCQKSAKDVPIFCLQKVSTEAFHCKLCEREVCSRCLKGDNCYICRLKNNANTNNEAALKKLKKEHLKTILKKLGLKSEAFRNATEDQMIRQIVKKCDLDGSAKAFLPSTSFKKDDGVQQATKPSNSTDPTSEHKAQSSEHKKTTGDFPLLPNIQNEDEIKQMSIPQIRAFLKYYDKFDASMNEKREFQEVAIQLWRTAMKIPVNGDQNRKQTEQQQHQEQVVEVHGNHEVAEQNDLKKRESFTLPAEGQGGIPMMGETIQNPQEPTIFVKPVEIINDEEEILGWSTKQLEAFLKKHGRYNSLWQEKSTLQYEAIAIWRKEKMKAQQGNATKEDQKSSEIQEPVKSPDVQPKICITTLPQPQHDDSDDSEDGGQDKQREPHKFTTFRINSIDQEMVHEENCDVKPKVVLTELQSHTGHQNETKVEVQKTQHSTLQGMPSLHMEDFQDYDNIEAFMGYQNGGDTMNKEEFYIENHVATNFAEMASSSMETSDSFVYIQPPNDDAEEKTHRPDSLPLKNLMSKRVEFSPVTEQISDSEDESYLQVREYIEGGAAGSSFDAVAGPSHFEVPLSPEEFFDTLREMESNMKDTSEVPDFTQAVRKRLNSDKSVETSVGEASWNDYDDADQDGMHTPEEFLGTVYNIQANLTGNGDLAVNRDVDLSSTAQRLSELEDTEETTYSAFEVYKFKEAESESGQSANLKDAKVIDIPLIENTNTEVNKILKTKGQRPESWGVSMDEILSEENIKQLKKRHLKLLLHKDGINSEPLSKSEMIKEVTKLWLSDKQNRISIYEEAVSEEESGDESEGKISPDTEFEICSLPPLPSPPPLDPQIVHVTFKDDQGEMVVQNHDVQTEHLSLSDGAQKVMTTESEICSLPPLPSPPGFDPKREPNENQNDSIIHHENVSKNQNDSIIHHENVSKNQNEYVIHQENVSKNQNEYVIHQENVSKNHNDSIIHHENVSKNQNDSIIHHENVSKNQHEYVIYQEDRYVSQNNSVDVSKNQNEYVIHQEDRQNNSVDAGNRIKSLDNSVQIRWPYKKPETPKKPPVPLPPTRTASLGRTSSYSAYLTFVMSEEEIENFEEYKLRAILRTAKVSLKDIWKREDLIEEVIKVWKQEQLDRGRSLERSYSSSSFSLNRSRRSSTESLQQEVDFDNIQSEKDLERLTSRNLQNYLLRNNVPIQGLLLHEHFLREAIKHWKKVTKAQAQEPEVLLEHIASEKEIESLSAEAIRAVLIRHGLEVGPEEQKEDLVSRLKVLWQRKYINKEDHENNSPQTPKIEERVHEEIVQFAESKEEHSNKDISFDTKDVSMRQETRMEQVQTTTTTTSHVEFQGPPKPQRVSKLETLDDISSPEIIRKMEIKQMKALLDKHSVSYADCQERHEIVQRLENLWNDKKKHENIEMQPEELCKICLSERADCVLLECGHVVTCTDCGHKITECPVCRNYVVKVVRLYKS